MSVEIAYQFAMYFPYYVLLCLFPVLGKIAVDMYVLNIDYRRLEVETYKQPKPPSLRPFVFPFTGALRFENAYQIVAFEVLLMPFAEEMVFRGIPYLLLGNLGVILGSAVWAIAHPAYHLQLLWNRPLKQRLGFALSSLTLFSFFAYFYSLLWISGAFATAVLYHMFHNGWITAAEFAREVELPIKRKRFAFVKIEKEEKAKPRKLPKILKPVKMREKKVAPTTSLEGGEPKFTFIIKEGKPETIVEAITKANIRRAYVEFDSYGTRFLFVRKNY